jgi:large subunit ribosomal protein L35
MTAKRPNFVTPASRTAPPGSSHLLSIPAGSGISRALADRLLGLPWRRYPLNTEQPLEDTCLSSASRPRGAPCLALKADLESKMPKMKTKSGAKKRFKITASGKVKYTQAGKRHGMIKRTTKQIRNHRGTAVLFKTDGDNIKKYWLPNG